MRRILRTKKLQLFLIRKVQVHNLTENKDAITFYGYGTCCFIT